MRRIACTLLCVGLAAGAQAQPRLPPGVDGTPAGTGGALATRSVSTYLARERELLDALQRGRREAVRGMLADDFEVHNTGRRDATPVDEWLGAALQAGAGRATVRDLAVREFDDIATVSFLIDRGRGVPAQSVVDVWRQSSRRLLVRYVSKPSQVPPALTRPTGRE